MKLTRAASIVLPAVIGFAGAAALAGLTLVANASPARPASAAHLMAATRPAAAAPRIALYDCDNKPVVRPGEFDIFCDGSDSLAKLNWTSWNTTEAVGTGVNWIDSCVPNCAAGKWQRENVIVVLWRGEPVAHHKGQSAYSKMTLLFTGSGRSQTLTPPGAYN